MTTGRRTSHRCTGAGSPITKWSNRDSRAKRTSGTDDNIGHHQFTSQCETEPHVHRELPTGRRVGRRRRPAGPEPARRTRGHVRRGPALRPRGRRVRRQPVRGPLPRPGGVLAALQPAGARARGGRSAAAAGAHPLPRDLRQQPRRVLHGPGRRPQAPDRGRRRRPRGLRADATRRAGADLDGHGRAHLAARGGLPRADRARPRQGGHRARPLGPARPRGAEELQAAVQGARLPGAHPAGRGPGTPLPLHLRALPQPRRPRPQPQDRQGALRARQGAADLQPVRAAGQPALRPPRGRDRRAPQAALPRAWRCSA